MGVSGHHVPVWYDEATGPDDGQGVFWNATTGRFEAAAVDISALDTSGLATDAALTAGLATKQDTISPGTYVPSGSLMVNLAEVPYSAISGHAARLQAGVDAAASAGGGTVYVPSTLQMGSGVTLPSNVTLVMGPLAWLESTAATGAIISASGTIAATTATLTANVAKGASTLTVDSTAGLVADDVFIMGDSAQPDSGSPTALNGEMLRVKTVDSGTQITVKGIVRDDYTTAAGAKLQKVTPVVNVGLHNVRVKNMVQGASTTTMAKFFACVGVKVTQSRFENADLPGVQVDSCMDVTVADSTFKDFTDDLANGRPGYGVNVAGACDTVHITDNKFHRNRHAVTTNGAAASGGYGQPRNVLVTGNTATDCTAAAFDTHAHGRQITFQDNAVFGTMGAGFQIRSGDTRVIGNTVQHAVGNSIVITTNAHGAEVRGNTLKHCQNHSVAVTAALDAVVITDNNIDGAKFNGVHISANATRLTICRNRIFNIGVPTAQGHGIQFAVGVTSTGHIIAHNIGGNFSTGTETGLTPGKMRSLVVLPATVTGSYVAHNLAAGLLIATMIDDLGSNTKVGNIRLDATTIAAYTQTFATASRTHASPTATSVATTPATSSTPFGYSQAQADALVATVNALIVDLANVKQVLNAVIDDGQALNLLG